jgi:hypothetical protein
LCHPTRRLRGSLIIKNGAFGLNDHMGPLTISSSKKCAHYATKK